MDEQERAERLSEAIDRLAIEDGAVETNDQKIRELLSLAVALREAMPPVRSDPAFERSLRARLVGQQKPSWWSRLLLIPADEGRTGRRGFHPALRYALATAAAALLVVGALFLLRSQQPEESRPAQAQIPAPSEPAAAAQAQATLAFTPAATAAPAQPGLTMTGEARQAADGPSPKAAGAPAAVDTAPLPQLPPLSATMPRMVAGGLGGGGAGDAGESEKQTRFQLEVPLPDLGSSATVFRYRQPAPDPDGARRTAANFGFDPSAVRPVGEPGEGAFVAQQPGKGSVEFLGPAGPVVYNTEPAYRGFPGQHNAPPEDSRAVEMATRWLAENSLLPPGAGRPAVQLPFPEADLKEVIFRPAEPANIVTGFPQVRVSVRADGVASYFFLWPETESTLSYPARSADSAWTLVLDGKAKMRFGGAPEAPGSRTTVRITSVERGYALTFGLDERPYLQPVVVFSGEAGTEGEPKSLPFSAEVPLVADSALSSGQMNYILAAPLTEVPAEMAVVERTAPEKLTAEWVRDLGQKLGLPGEPRLMGQDGPPGMPTYWEMRDAQRGLILTVRGASKAMGGWSELWSFGSIGETAEAPGPVPSAEEALRIAEGFLRGKGLLTPDLGEARVQPAGPGGVSSVIFQGNVERLPLVDEGVMTVLVDSSREVTRVISNQHVMKVVRRAKLLTPEQALEAIRAGRGQVESELPPFRTAYSDHAEIEKVSLAYRMRTPEATSPGPGGPPTPPAPLYEPHYLFSGTMEVGESQKRMPFTTSLPAIVP